MSDHAVQSYNDGNGTVGQSRRPCQSAWMAHWSDTSCKTGGRASLSYEFKEDGHATKHRSFLSGSEVETNVSIVARESEEVTDVGTAKIMDEREQYDRKPFPMFHIFENKESVLAVKTRQTSILGREVIASQTDPNSGYESPTRKWISSEAESPSKKGHFQHPEKPVKFHNFFEKSNLAASRSSKDDFMGSTFKTLPCGVTSSAPLLSMHIGEETNPSSSCLVQEKRSDRTLNARGPGFSLTGTDDSILSLRYPSASNNNQLPVVVGKQCKKPLDQMGIEPSSRERYRPELSKSENLHQRCYSLPGVPCSVSDMDAVKICTTMDSMEEQTGHPSKIRHTNHLQMIRDSRLSAKIKGKMLSELLSLSQDSRIHGQQRMKLQLLGSSTDSEEKENSGHVTTSVHRLKNESSEDTNTIEMNALQENLLSGTTSYPSDKVDGSRFSPLSEAALASAREDAGQRSLDINQRLPEIRAVASSPDDRDTSSSRTQSLGVERLFSNPEQAEDSKSNACPDGLSGPDPSSRWIKRLKSSASDSFGHGTKLYNMPEASSHEKASKFFSKIVIGSTTSSEASRSRSHGKDEIKLDKTAVFSRNADLFVDQPLAHSWIRRWCHNQAMTTQKNAEPDVICEPENFKETSDKFPSIAAMAMMGKAVKRFRPCEFQKLGHSVVWNTKRF